jgi:peptidoglycan/xylan/chitin deacetylase (PgdA/CDA1 family)
MSAKAAVTILTYHRITNKHSESWHFHDVAMPRFQSQMIHLSQRATRAEGPLHYLERGQPVVLTFDDGTADHLTVGTMLQEHGLLGTFFVISGRLGQTGFLSGSGVRRLAALGHRIGSHTVTHRRLPSLGTAQIVDELGSSKAMLEDLTGKAVDWLAPPGGVLCSRSLAVAMELGFKVVRTMEWGYAPLPPAGVVPCLPVLQQYSLHRFERLLDGRAPTWLFHVKRHLKNVLGDQFYTVCRNNLARKYTSARSL